MIVEATPSWRSLVAIAGKDWSTDLNSPPPEIPPRVELRPPLTLATHDPRAEGLVPASGAPEHVAMLVCHGMGQQVRFETLLELAETLRNAPDAQIEGRIGARLVRVGDKDRAQSLYRAELTLRQRDGQHRVVHLYEAYWAPLTEGRVNIRDVLAFLGTAAWQGTVNTGGRVFRRWMFGRPIPLPIHATSTRWKIIVAFLVVLGLAVINSAISVIGASRIVSGGRSGWPCDPTLLLLTKELAVLVGLMVLVGLSFWLMRWLRKRKVEQGLLAQHKPAAGARFTWLCIWAAILGIGVAAAATVIELVWSVTCREAAQDLSSVVLILMVALWGLIHLLSLGVRYFLIEYLGDVAAYISAHAVSKFNDVRTAIQDVSFQVAKAIYTARREDGGAFEYGRVIVVGHSLGSVIAYDALNAIIREDLAAAAPFDAVRRTRMLLTFGSPLNKTAFIFRMRMPEGAELREALAAEAQPLIQHYDLRPAEWVNIYSKADWIGGPLQFYDDPDDVDPAHVAKKVQNLPDPHATTPLAAHGEYWNNPLLRERLVRAVFA